MHMVDRQIGKILALLEELELDENTVFFLCGDMEGRITSKQQSIHMGFLHRI